MPTLRLLLACSLLASTSLLAQETPPGSPKPSVGAPGDKPGRNDPFGSQGEKAEETKSQAEKSSENRQPVITQVEFEGNKHTRVAEMRRHLVLKEGDDLDDDKVLTSRIRLLQFGAFDTVEAQVIPLRDRMHVKLHIKVHERNAIFITDAVYGSTAYTKHYGVFGIADANFAGVGLGLAAQALVADNGQHAFRLSLYEPDFQINDISFVGGIQGLEIRGRENACGHPACFATGPELRYHRAGGEASFGVRNSSYERFVFGYRFEAVDAESTRPSETYSGPPVNVGRSYISSLTGSFDRDARDDTFLPTHGSRIQFSVNFNSKALGSSYEFSRYLLQVEKWFPQKGGRAFRIDATAGAVQGDAPFFERFYAADWSYFSLGSAVSRLLQMNLSPDARYDAILALVGLEYDFPLWKAPKFILRRGYLALGGRATWSEASPGSGRTPVSRSPFSFDASIRVDTPYGLFNISLAYLADLVF